MRDLFPLNSISDLGNRIKEGFADVIRPVTDFLTTIYDKITAFQTAVEGFENNVKEWLLSIPQAIGDNIRALFEEFFMPDAEKIQKKLDAIKVKFAFVFQIQELVESFIDMLKASTGFVPPSFTINLGDKADGIWGLRPLKLTLNGTLLISPRLILFYPVLSGLSFYGVCTAEFPVLSAGNP